MITAIIINNSRPRPIWSQTRHASLAQTFRSCVKSHSGLKSRVALASGVKYQIHRSQSQQGVNWLFHLHRSTTQRIPSDSNLCFEEACMQCLKSTWLNVDVLAIWIVKPSNVSSFGPLFIDFPYVAGQLKAKLKADSLLFPRTPLTLSCAKLHPVSLSNIIAVA